MPIHHEKLRGRGVYHTEFLFAGIVEVVELFLKPLLSILFPFHRRKIGRVRQVAPPSALSEISLPV